MTAPEPVKKALEQPLPQPAEDVVEDSPVGQVRDTVRGTLGASPSSGSNTQSGGSGGGSASSPAAGSGSDGTSATGRSAEPVSSGSRQGGGNGGGAGGSENGGAQKRAPATPARAAAAKAGAAKTGASTAKPRRSPSAADDRGPLARTFNGIAEVVPSEIWIALVVLASLALILAGRGVIERRRRRRLEREREQLLGDLGLLQRALLPDVPERLGDLAVSVAYRPAEGPAAGGDFYDAFELPGGRVGAILGDVSGHGREALVRTASVRHSLRTLLRSGLQPREALAAASRLLTDEAEGEFVTVVAVAHDPATGELTYATAGHPPPIVCGGVEHEPVTVASSPPLGLGLPTGLRQTTIAMPKDAVACLFTDGLLEARVDGDLLGRERLAQMVAALAPWGGADELLARMLDETDEPADDMAACVLRAVGGPEETTAARREEIVVGPHATALAGAGELLLACGVSEVAVAHAMDEAATTVAASGEALLVATFPGGDPHVSVEARTESPLRPSGIAERVSV